MGALKTYPRDRRKRAAGTPPCAPARQAPPDLRGKTFRLPANLVSRRIEAATARALDREYLNGVLSAFHYLRSPAGEREALGLLKRREDRLAPPRSVPGRWPGI
jgi:hypothetical protein